MTSPSIPLKRCTKCGQEFPATIEYFSANRSKKGGLNNWCRPCKHKADKEYQSKPEIREKLRSYHREYSKEYRKDEVGLERKRQINREHMRRRRLDPAKRETDNNRTLEYLKTPAGRASQSRRGQRYAQTERGKANARRQQSKRRAQKLANGGSHTVEDIQLQYKSQKGLCWWCGEPVGNDYEIDHRLALVRGGSDDAGNLVISCRPCNRSKGDKLPHEFNGRLL